MSRYQELLNEYISLRQTLGFHLRKNQTALLGFVSFLEKESACRITTELVVRWVKLPQDCHPNWWAERFSIVRDFAEYCKTKIPRTEVPPAGMFQYQKHRPSPHIYSDSEVAQILLAARQLSGGTGLRPWTYSTLFGLLAATGLRTGEGLKLDRSDVDLAQGVLTVRQAKFDKSRLVPVQPSTLSSTFAVLTSLPSGRVP